LALILAIGLASLAGSGCSRDRIVETYPNGKPKIIRTYGWFGGARPENLIRERTFYFNNHPETDVRFRDGVRHGAYEDFRHNGQRKSKGEYRDGKKEGEWEYFHNQFTVSSRGGYRGDLKEGEWRSYWQNGEVKSQGDYRAGLEIGTWMEWTSKGESLSENSCFEANEQGRYLSYHGNKTVMEDYACFKGVPTGAYAKKDPEGGIIERGAFDARGRKDGLWVTYHPGGSKASETRYAGGREHDSAYAWDQAGRLRERARFDSGTGERLAYDSLGRLTDGKRFRDGRPDGEFRVYWPDGSLRSVMVYREGMPMDLRKWHANGKVSSEGRFAGGQRAGAWKDYWDNGKPREEARYEGGLLHGERLFYDAKGGLLRTQRYERGYPAEGKIPAAVARGGIIEGMDLAEAARKDKVASDTGRKVKPDPEKAGSAALEKAGAGPVSKDSAGREKRTP